MYSPLFPPKDMNERNSYLINNRKLNEETINTFGLSYCDNKGEIYQVDWDQSDNGLVGTAQPRFQLPPVYPQGTTAERYCLIKVSRPCLQ